MKNEIFSLWYKQPSMLTSTPTMARMIRTEGIEAYGLYIHFADTLHLLGGFQEYNLNDISLTLGYTKKLIKAKLNRVLNDYKLFDFFLDDDGIEYIGLERIKNDIASLNKHKENGAKGGKKRAENYRNKSLSKDSKPETQIAKETSITSVETEAPEYEVASFFYDFKYSSQLAFLIKHPFRPRAKHQAYKDYMLKNYPEKIEEIEKKI
ncbi:hypothetical protein N9473_04520 [Polaribacter sp.]|nr:hypothetical protein [Polaribacter sp.]